MKINNLKSLLIVVCSVVSTLYSEAHCMEACDFSIADVDSDRVFLPIVLAPEDIKKVRKQKVILWEKQVIGDHRKKYSNYNIRKVNRKKLDMKDFNMKINYVKDILIHQQIKAHNHIASTLTDFKNKNNFDQCIEEAARRKRKGAFNISEEALEMLRIHNDWGNVAKHTFPPDISPVSVREKLSALITEFGSQKLVAEKISIPQPRISEYLKNKCNKQWSDKIESSILDYEANQLSHSLGNMKI